MNDEWRESAACRGMDTNIFFPGRGDNLTVKAAKVICARCPVRENCLGETLTYEEDMQVYPTGIFGGLSADERVDIKRTRSRPCIVCAAPFTAGRRNQRSCGAKECQKAVARMRQGPTPHGTVNGYSNYGCRCGDCTEAKRVDIATRRAA